MFPYPDKKRNQDDPGVSYNYNNVRQVESNRCLEKGERGKESKINGHPLANIRQFEHTLSYLSLKKTIKVINNIFCTKERAG